jgi:hypothetical protein
MCQSCTNSVVYRTQGGEAGEPITADYCQDCKRRKEKSFQLPIYPETPLRKEFFAITDKQLTQLGWSEKECRDYVREFYGGKISRHHLSDYELAHFMRQLNKIHYQLRKNEHQ